MNPPTLIPLRPMTVGELLDAAATLLRAHWRPLLTGSFALALVEQVLMTWLRLATVDDLRPRYQYDLWGDQNVLWLWMTLGLTSEIMVITALGAPASRAMRAALAGETDTGWRTLYARGVPWGPVLAVVAVLGVLGGVAAAMCGLPWFLLFGFTGLIVPVLVIDRVGPGAAVGRGLSLAGKGSGRAFGVRLLGYASWLLVRLAVSCGSYYAADEVTRYAAILDDHYWLVLGIAYLAINTMAYAMLACLDATAHVETRIRSEGLDIVLARAAANGTGPDLSPPRPPMLPPGVAPMPPRPMGAPVPPKGPHS